MSPCYPLRSPKLEYIDDHDASPTHVILMPPMQARFGFCSICNHKVEGRTQVETGHVDSHDFKKIELSNPNKDQDLESGGFEYEDIMEKFQQHTRVLPINQERLGTCLENGKGLPIFETIFVILI